MMFETNHYSFLTSDPESQSHTLPGKPNWFILRYDSKSRKEDVFSLQVLEALLQRNNFAVYSDDHYYPFPFRSTSAGELDAALRSLAERLLKHFNGGTPMEHLITIYTADPQASLLNPLPRIPCHRSYHGPKDVAKLTGTNLDISDSFLHSDPALPVGSFPEVQEADKFGDAVMNTLSYPPGIDDDTSYNPTAVDTTSMMSDDGTSEDIPAPEPAVWADPSHSLTLCTKKRPDLPKQTISSKSNIARKATAKKVETVPTPSDWKSHFMRTIVSGDGDCFFSAVNIAMRNYNSAWNHTSASLRALALTQLEIDIPKYLGISEAPDFLTWEALKAQNQHKGQYADNPIMVALARKLNIAIQLHGASNQLLRDEFSGPLTTIHLLYCGTPSLHYPGNHYDTLFPKPTVYPIWSPTPRRQRVDSDGWTIITQRSRGLTHSDSLQTKAVSKVNRVTNTNTIQEFFCEN
jgi:hypothetical protein